MPSSSASSSDESKGSSGSMLRAYLVLSNAVIMVGWANVLRTIILNWEPLQDPERSNPFCDETLRPALKVALTLSFIEVFNALVGVTRSKPHQALLFSLVRAGVEYWVTPLMAHCGVWQHVMTISAWSFGDTIRFACFCVDSLFPGHRMARSIRYTVGPLLFPVGAGGEMLMVIAAAMDGRPRLYYAAAIWPFGFYSLMKQLLKQRRKFFAQTTSTTAPTAPSKSKGAKLKAV